MKKMIQILTTSALGTFSKECAFKSQNPRRLLMPSGKAWRLCPRGHAAAVLLCMALLCVAQCSGGGNGGNGGGDGGNPDDGPVGNPLCAKAADTSTEFNGGDGTAGDPFLICSRAQLEKIADDLTLNYELGQNIDLSDSNFTPIAGAFTGSLNGKGYKILNLTISVATRDVGLFEKLGTDGSIPESWPRGSRRREHI